MQHWFFEDRGLRLRVWELSGGHDPTVVCLHGWLDQGLAFERMARGRAGRWLALDQRGFGGSEHASAGGWYHFPNYVADLDALYRHLGERPLHLVGHSMGGTVACYYAGARPERVASLSIVEGLGALATSEASMLTRTRKFLDGLETPPRRIPLRSVDDAAQRLHERHTGLSLEHARLLAEHGTTRVGDKLTWSFDPQHMVRSPYPFSEAAFCAFLQEITCPVLAVFGTEGWYPEEVRSRRLQALSNPRVEVVEGSHMLPYDAAEAVGDLVSAHIDHTCQASPPP